MKATDNEERKKQTKQQMDNECSCKRFTQSCWLTRLRGFILPPPKIKLLLSTERSNDFSC